jgi:hypothetical protein
MYALVERPVPRYCLGHAAHENTAGAFAVDANTLRAAAELESLRTSPRFGPPMRILETETLCVELVDTAMFALLQRLSVAHDYDCAPALLEGGLQLCRYMDADRAFHILRRFALDEDNARTHTALMQVLRERPWHAFFEGHIDRAGLLQALADAGYEADEDWVRLKQFYDALARYEQVGGVDTFSLGGGDAESMRPMAERLVSLEMADWGTPEQTTLVLRVHEAALGFLHQFIVQTLGASRTPTRATDIHNQLIGIEMLLAERDVLAVDTLAPTALAMGAQVKDVCDACMLSVSAEQAAAVMTSIDELVALQTAFAEGTRAAMRDERLPVLALRDVHLWSPVQMARVLSLLFFAPQRNTDLFFSAYSTPAGVSHFSVTRSAAPFKLLLFYDSLEVDRGSIYKRLLSDLPAHCRLACSRYRQQHEQSARLPASLTVAAPLFALLQDWRAEQDECDDMQLDARLWRYFAQQCQREGAAARAVCLLGEISVCTHDNRAAHAAHLRARLGTVADEALFVPYEDARLQMQLTHRAIAGAPPQYDVIRLAWDDLSDPQKKCPPSFRVLCTMALLCRAHLVVEVHCNVQQCSLGAYFEQLVTVLSEI